MDIQKISKIGYIHNSVSIYMSYMYLAERACVQF